MGSILAQEAEFLDERKRALIDVKGSYRGTPAQIKSGLSRRAKDRPLCPICGEDEVRTNGRKRRQYWRCYACGHKWSELILPNKTVYNTVIIG